MVRTTPRCYVMFRALRRWACRLSARHANEGWLPRPRITTGLVTWHHNVYFCTVWLW
jgi:hypothetical protein